ncbi:MAG: hypothetical protein HY094_08075 [Candidatus Melainabacteria bacterium]|nr:hypothetical protein [Candidatus Melainabacteria bacterium]
MGKVIRPIFGDENNSLVHYGELGRPYETNIQNPEKKTSSESNTKEILYKTSPYGAIFRQIIDPALRELRSRKWNPRDRATTERSLLEQLLYLAESKLES